MLRVNEGGTGEAVLKEDFLAKTEQERLGPMKDLTLCWASQFRIAQLQSKRYAVVRWVLAGDAAHAMEPSAGSGMQLGLLGAWRLGWRIALGLQRPGKLLALLDDYAREHRQTADLVQRANGVIFRNMALTSSVRGKGREVALALLGKVQAIPTAWPRWQREKQARSIRRGPVIFRAPRASTPSARWAPFVKDFARRPLSLCCCPSLPSRQGGGMRSSRSPRSPGKGAARQRGAAVCAVGDSNCCARKLRGSRSVRLCAADTTVVDVFVLSA